MFLACSSNSVNIPALGCILCSQCFPSSECGPQSMMYCVLSFFLTLTLTNHSSCLNLTNPTLRRQLALATQRQSGEDHDFALLGKHGVSVAVYDIAIDQCLISVFIQGAFYCYQSEANLCSNPAV